MTGPDASMQRENKRLEEQLRSKDSELEKINSLYGDAECKLETAIINNKNFNEKIINLEKELNSSKKDHLILETKQNKFLGKFFFGPIYTLRSKIFRENNETISRVKGENAVINSENVRLKIDLKDEKAAHNTWKKRYNSLANGTRVKNLTQDNSLIEHLRKQNISLRERINQQDKIIKLSSNDALSEESIRPKTVLEAIEMAEYMFESLYFFDDAKKSAKDSRYNNPELILEIFNIISESFSKFITMDPGTGTFEELLRKDGNGKFRVAEQNSKNLLFQTKDQRGGITNKTMVKHIILGTARNPERTIRIYFDVERENEIIQIGWCGKHPN